MNFLKDTYETYGTDVSGRLNIIGFVLHDSGAYPTADEFNGFHLLIGTKLLDVTDGSIYYFDGISTWNLKSNSLFDNVYTKTEVDTILMNYYTKSEVDTQVSNLHDYDENQDKYIYALIGQSSLNYLDSSVWAGTTTSGNGYVMRDLPVNIPAGTYTWKMKRDGNTTTAFVIKAADDTELYRVNRGAGVNDITQEFTITADAAKISIYVGFEISYSDNMIFKVIL